MSVVNNNNVLFNFLISPKNRILRHVLFTSLFVFVAIGQSFFLFEQYAEPIGHKIYLYVISLIIVYVSFAYANLYYLSGKFLLKGKYTEYILSLIVSVIVILLFKNIIEHEMLKSIGVERKFNGVTFLDNLSNLTLNVICLGSSLVAIFFKQFMNDSNRINELEVQQLQNKIEEIKTHINPQFLFNVIDTASAKVKSNADEASGILYQLSKVLRYGLYDAKRDKVILKSDIDFIRNFLILEQANSERDFEFSVDVSGNTGQFIHPYVFMPLVQEIIKLQPQALHIAFDIENNTINFVCKIKGADLVKADFSVIRQHLQKLYRDKVEFSYSNNFLKLQIINV